MAVAGALAAVHASADLAPWLEGPWEERRVVDAVVKTPVAAEGDEVAVADFFSGGLVRPDGRDVRVADAEGRFVSHRVLQMGPGDLVRVAFAVSPGVERYYVYYGNESADPPPPWRPKRGVLLEARRWKNGDLGRLTAVRDAWQRAPALGADFVPNVSLGFNPFADSSVPVVFRFVGFFRADEAGRYQVATSSDGPSWVLVDGEEVVSWPGQHGATSRARHTKPVSLTAGVHRLDYWYVNPGGQVIAVAAWRRPGQTRYEAIPPSAFLPVVEASLVERDVKGRRVVADFFPEKAGQTWWPDHYAVRVRFRNLSRGVSRRHGGSFRWDFGDGQTSTEAEPDHVYLAHGDYKVALRVSRGAMNHTFETTVRVEPDWYKQTSRHVEPRGRYAHAVAEYDLAALETDGLVHAADLFAIEELRVPTIKAAGLLALKRDDLPEPQALQYGRLLGEQLLAADRPQEALEAYRRIEQRLKSPARRAEMAARAAGVLLNHLHRYDQAEAEFRRVLDTFATIPGRIVRQAHIGIGDVRRHEGKTDEARQAYAEAERIDLKSRGPKHEAIRIGTLARYVEDHTREGRWEWVHRYLDEWAWEFPEEKLKGHWSYLRGKALAAQGKWADALREAHDLLACNPQSAYAVRLLVLAAECQEKLGQRDRARLMLQTAVEDYPEDPHREEARAKLTALGGPLVTEGASSP